MPSGTSDPAATTDPLPMRAPFRTVAPMPISAVVFDGAAVQRDRMPHRHPVADGQRKPFVQVQHAVVLNAGLRADADGPDVAAQGRVRPDAGPFADVDVADDLRAGIDVGGCRDPWARCRGMYES